MTIYWSRDSIPALRGLSSEEKKVATMSVAREVWRHWQVWLPFAALFFGYVLFYAFAPQFPYRFLLVIVSAPVLAQLASLPFYSYLQHYLSTRREEP